MLTRECVDERRGCVVSDGSHGVHPSGLITKI